jgi:hypothetical protein
MGLQLTAFFGFGDEDNDRNRDVQASLSSLAILFWY